MHADPNRVVRSLAAQYGFYDPTHDGELRITFDGKGRSIRYLRPSGVSLDRFGELLADRGVTDRRLTPAEVADLLSTTFDSRSSGKAQKPPSRAALSRAETKARKMRMRKWQCGECKQIVRGTRNSSIACGVCYEMSGRIVMFTRVDPLPEEIAEMNT